MSDVVVTVPMSFTWEYWIKEGDAAGDAGADAEWEEMRQALRENGVDPSPSRLLEEFPEYHWDYSIAAHRLPKIRPGERVYVVAHRKLRGYAPLVALEAPIWPETKALLCRGGGAVAVTIPEEIIGFRGWRYRWWKCAAEVPFPEWRTP